MNYLRIKKDDIDLSGFDPRVYRFFIEVDEKGVVEREIALDASGKVVHAYPNKKFKYGGRGMFDLAVFEVKGLQDDITAEEFEQMWGLVRKV